MQRDRSAHIHTCAFQSPGRHLDTFFHRHSRHGHSQVLYFLGKTEMNTGDKHVSGPFSVTTESWHRASVEQSQGSGRAFLSAAIAGVRVWAPWPHIHLHAAQLSLEMGSDLPGLDASGRPLVSHCSLGSGQNHQRPQNLSSRPSAVLHCQLNLVRGRDFRAEQQHLVKAGWAGWAEKENPTAPPQGTLWGPCPSTPSFTKHGITVFKELISAVRRVRSFFSCCTS